MTLAALALAAMNMLATPSEPVPPSQELAAAISDAVAQDEDGRLTGSAEGDVALMVREAWDESRWGWQWSGRTMVHDSCPEGDGGRAFGYWQLQTRREIGCSVGDAARWWLAWAHGSQRRCRLLPLAEQLAELHSGTCARGHVLSRWRWRQAMRLLPTVMPED
jgi:hypothetical protein